MIAVLLWLRSNWKMLAILAAVAGIAFGGWRFAKAMDERATLQQQLAQTQAAMAHQAQQYQEAQKEQDAAMASMQKERNAAVSALSARNARIQQLTIQERKTDAALQQALQNPVVRKWANDPLPAAVIGSLRDPAGAAAAAGHP